MQNKINKIAEYISSDIEEIRKNMEEKDRISIEIMALNALCNAGKESSRANYKLNEADKLVLDEPELKVDSSLNEQKNQILETGVSKDKKYATYKVEDIREVMHFLHDLDSDKAKEMFSILSCPNRKSKKMSEAELRYCSLTNGERSAFNWALSLEKDSDTLETIKKLSLFKNSESL